MAPSRIEQALSEWEAAKEYVETLKAKKAAAHQRYALTDRERQSWDRRIHRAQATSVDRFANYRRLSQ